MEQTEITEDLPVLGERITINTYETQCANPTCDEQIEFDTTLPTGWDLKEIKISITCPKCVDAKPAHRKTRTRRGQEARPRGHRRRDLLLPVNGSLTNPQLLNSIEEFLPWDGEEELENAVADLAEAVNTPEPTPEPEVNSMRQAADRQQLRTRQKTTDNVAINLPTWEPPEKEVEITNPNYPPVSAPVRPLPKSEEPSRIRKRRRAVSVVADQQEKEMKPHPSTIECHFCESRQLPDVEICTNCARDVHTGKLPEIDEAEEESEDDGAPEIDLSSRTIKKMKKGGAIDVARSLGLSTDGTVKDLKARLTAHRNSMEEE